MVYVFVCCMILTDERIPIVCTLPFTVTATDTAIICGKSSATSLFYYIETPIDGTFSPFSTISYCFLLIPTIPDALSPGCPYFLIHIWVCVCVCSVQAHHPHNPNTCGRHTRILHDYYYHYDGCCCRICHFSHSLFD